MPSHDLLTFVHVMGLWTLTREVVTWVKLGKINFAAVEKVHHDSANLKFKLLTDTYSLDLNLIRRMNWLIFKMIIFCHCWEIENKLIAKYQSNHESDDMVKIQKLQQTDRGTRLKPHLPVWTELTWISFTFILKDDGIQFYKIIRCIGGSRGRARRAPP